jgi:hypothetical protein
MHEAAGHHRILLHQRQGLGITVRLDHEQPAATGLAVAIDKEATGDAAPCRLTLPHPMAMGVKVVSPLIDG